MMIAARGGPGGAPPQVLGEGGQAGSGGGV
jgi:hypothetical protein